MSSNKDNELILVTGAGGFIAMHVIDKFLSEGYKVRGTVRSLSNEGKVAPLRNLKGAESRLELVEADLLNADSWEKAMKGVTILLHVASPFPSQQPADEMELIRPALDGTLNVLKEAFKNRDTVKRVVLTSSTIAVFGQVREPRAYSEKDWPDPTKLSVAYAKSKTLAEKAAWDFVEEKKKANEKCFELAVINPSFVLGPTFHGQSVVLGTSESRIKSYLEGSVQEVPRINLPTCDVRDVANAHFIAAFLPEAVGHRHLIVSQPEFIPMITLADILREEFQSKGYTNIPTNVSKEGAYVQTTIDNSRMLNVLGIKPIPLRQSVLDAANSLIENGIVTKSN